MSRRSGKGLRRRTPLDPRWPWPAGIATVLASSAAAVALLRPRSGLIDPDPVSCDELFDAAEVTRARAYRRAQMLLGAASTAAQTGALLALARRPARTSTGGPRASAARTALVDAGRGASLIVALTAIGLPFDAVGHRRARAVGLATQDWGGWGADVAKTAGIGVPLAAGVSAGVLALMRRAPRTWWLGAAGAGIAGGTLLAFLSPVLLDPAFNRFEPLAAGPLRDAVFALAEQAGVRVREVYEIDASRRTTAANAYVTGLGPTKRVVLFDTLLEGFSDEEARVVVAHELAHVRHRDVSRGLAYTAIVAPAALQAASTLTRALQPGAGEPDLATLGSLALSLGLIGALLGVSAGPLMRALETHADVASLRLTGAPEAFISFERKIVTQNLADPNPPRWLVALGASHPPALARIGVARAYDRLERAPDAPASGHSLGSEPG